MSRTSRELVNFTFDEEKRLNDGEGSGYHEEKSKTKDRGWTAASI
jgi:hypothetical protein